MGKQVSERKEMGPLEQSTRVPNICFFLKIEVARDV